MTSRKKRHYRGSSHRSRRARKFQEAAAGPKEDHTAVLLCERRALCWATLGVVVGLFFWIICIGTEQWVRVQAPDAGIYVNRTKLFFIRSHMGLFRMCRTMAEPTPAGLPGTEETKCSFFSVFPSEETIRNDVEIDRAILEYTRSEVAFCTISVALLLMGIGFSVYTFKERRYMFKRLAGGVHFLSAGVMVVIMEVESNSVTYEEKYLSSRHPKGCRWSFGFSYYFSWVTFCLYIGAGLTFILCSKKRKTMSVDEEEGPDDPRIVGRI